MTREQFAMCKTVFEAAPNKPGWEIQAMFRDYQNEAKSERVQIAINHMRQIEAEVKQGRFELLTSHRIPTDKIGPGTLMRSADASSYLQTLGLDTSWLSDIKAAPVKQWAINILTDEAARKWLQRRAWSIGEMRWLMHDLDPMPTNNADYMTLMPNEIGIDLMQNAIDAGDITALNTNNKGEGLYRPGDVIRTAESMDYGNWRLWANLLNQINEQQSAPTPELSLADAVKINDAAAAMGCTVESLLREAGTDDRLLYVALKPHSAKLCALPSNTNPQNGAYTTKGHKIVPLQQHYAESLAIAGSVEVAQYQASFGGILDWHWWMLDAPQTVSVGMVYVPRSQLPTDAPAEKVEAVTDTTPNNNEVYWRVVLKNKINTFDTASKKGRSTVREVIKSLQALNDVRIPRHTFVDTLAWIDDMGNRQIVEKKQSATR